MNGKLYTKSIRQLLNVSATRLDTVTLARLRDVRTQAVTRYEQHAVEPGYAWSGTWAGSLSGFWRGSGSHRSHYFWASAVLLAALVFSCSSYMQHYLDHDNSEVDLAILTDDLPIDVYVD